MSIPVLSCGAKRLSGGGVPPADVQNRSPVVRSRTCKVPRRLDCLNLAVLRSRATSILATLLLHLRLKEVSQHQLR